MKSLGLTLSQIRAVFAANPPSLLRILQAHATSWRAKRAMAKADNRSVDMKNAAALTRELINEHITPEEEREWFTWWANHPEDNADRERFTEEQQKLSAEASQLIDRGADPGSPAAQALLRRHIELMLKCHIRERTQRMCEWNAVATRKWTELGMQLSKRRDGERAEHVSRFWAQMQQASPWGLVFREEMSRVRAMRPTLTDPDDSRLDSVVDRVRETCATHNLGDPVTMIHYRRFMWNFFGRYYGDAEPFNAEWDLVEEAFKVREGEGG